jgi:hypothetical protein
MLKLGVEMHMVVFEMQEIPSSIICAIGAGGAVPQ